MSDERLSSEHLSLLRSTSFRNLQEQTMYDFYPEWGPARNRGDDELTPVRRRRYWQPGTGAEGRDAEVQRPDDN